MNKEYDDVSEHKIAHKTAEDHLKNLHRHMLSCKVECPLTVLWQANEKQKQRLNEFTLAYKAVKVTLWWSFSLPTDYLEGALTLRDGTQIYFGISPEGECHT
jgi:hypothetical protein